MADIKSCSKITGIVTDARNAGAGSSDRSIVLIFHRIVFATGQCFSMVCDNHIWFLRLAVINTVFRRNRTSGRAAVDSGWPNGIFFCNRTGIFSDSGKCYSESTCIDLIAFVSRCIISTFCQSKSGTIYFDIRIFFCAIVISYIAVRKGENIFTQHVHIQFRSKYNGRVIFGLYGKNGFS